MSFIPSIKLSEALTRAGVGVYIEKLGDGRIAIVCKAPETAIKALYRGAACTLLISAIQAESLTILCLGIRIDDERENPFKASMCNSSPKDAALLVQILASTSTTLHCMNELNHPVLSAWCKLESGPAALAADALRASDHWLLTYPATTLVKLEDLRQILNLALDRFQHHIHKPKDDPVIEYVKMTATLPLALDIWKPRELFEVTPTSASGPFVIGDRDEGKKLERHINVIMDSIYPGNGYLSPEVQDGKNRRELTDVLGFSKDFICVVQAKALAVLSAKDQSSDTRAANVTKDIRKGMGQLAGALTNIRNGSDIFPHEESTPLTLPGRDSSPAHAIVVLSEMYTFVDWKAVAVEVATASENEFRRALFHVLDIQEFANLANNCKDAETFNNRLFQRWCFIKERGNAYIRTQQRIGPPPDDHEDDHAP
ncbi:MAG TPA: hypothetical protein VE377_25700 [Candidatus Dormibacteraeota bacterium]|nr:hypothetical protein [Candidatus Dormibacteraeota bacterium]